VCRSLSSFYYTFYTSSDDDTYDRSKLLKARGRRLSSYTAFPTRFRSFPVSVTLTCRHRKGGNSMENEKEGKGTSILDTITEGVSSITEAMTGRTQKPRRRRKRSGTTKAAAQGRRTRRAKAKRSAGGRRSAAASSRRATRKSATSRGKAKRTSTRRTGSAAATRRSTRKTAASKRAGRGTQAKRSTSKSRTSKGGGRATNRRSR
jgi:hypothetical protein